jgi:3-dehydrosphinganine reductase
MQWRFLFFLWPLALTHSMKTISGKRVLITGGSSGIGLALAKQLAAQECKICILSRNADRLEKATDEIRHAAPTNASQIGTIQADVSDYNQLAPAVEDWIHKNGAPDILVNSAGVSRPGLFQEIDLEKFRWMMDINYFGAVHMTHLLLPKMIQRGSGQLVFVSSVAGFLGMIGYTAYAPTKFAVKGFVDSLRTEISHTGVKLSIVFPPDTETPSLEAEQPFQPPILVAMNENAPPMTADAVAKVILNGIARERYIITPGPDSSMYFKLVGLFGGGLLYPILDMFLADARGKVSRNPARYTRQNVGDPNKGSH